MRISQAGLLLLGTLTQAAHGQPNGVEAYGLLDLGVTTLDHSQPFDPALGTVPMTNKFADRRVTGLVSGNLQTSRIGLRGREDLGNGSSLLFALESHLNANNGTLGAGASSTGARAGATQAADSSCSGQLFCRQAWVGIQGDHGTLGVGRQYAFTYDIVAAYDPFIASNSLDGAGATQQGGGNTRDLRVDNSVKYTTRIGGAKLGAEYGFGGVPGRDSAGAFRGLTLGYEAGPFAIQGAWQKKTDSQIWSATTPAANTVYDTDTRTWLLAAKYRLGNVLLHGGYQQTGFSAGSNDLCVAGAGYVCGAAARYDGKRTDLWYGGLTYTASSHWTFVAAAYRLRQHAFQTGQAFQADGRQQDFSLMADYRLSRRTDLYAGMRHTGLAGGNAFGYAHTSFNLMTTGVRQTF